MGGGDNLDGVSGHLMVAEQLDILLKLFVLLLKAVGHSLEHLLLVANLTLGIVQ